MSKETTVLIPSFSRLNALTVTLTSLCYQTYTDFDIIIANQDENNDIYRDKLIQTIISVLSLHGHQTTIMNNLPRQGLAQQRQFLLDKVKTSYNVFLDNDLLLESYVISNMVKVIKKEQCGFVGCAPVGLSYLHDERPQQQHIEFWKGKVRAENIIPGSKQWQRAQLHNAANLKHVAIKYHASPENPKVYKVAWIGACVLYETEKLRSAGGFSFWKQIPKKHSGEDVMAQLNVIRKYGGCGILPSGVYHQELPTTIKNRRVNVPEYLLNTK